MAHFDKNPTFQGVFKKEWITEGINRDADNFADEFGKFLKNQSLTTNQIRNIFGEIKSIQMRLSEKEFKEEESNFILAKAKMAYAEGRNRSAGLSEFRKYFDLAHKEVKNKKSFENFVSFITAILAYHRAAGGK